MIRFIIALIVLVLPAIAAACPYCAGQQDNDTFYWILAAFVMLPFPVVGVVFYVIKRGEQAEENQG